MHTVEIYLRVVRYARYHSTFTTSEDLSLPLGAPAPYKGQWASFEAWIQCLFDQVLLIESLPIINNLVPVIDPGNAKKLFQQMVKLCADVSGSYRLLVSTRFHTSFSRFLSSKGHHTDARKQAQEASHLLAKYTAGSTPTPSLHVELDLAFLEIDMPSLSLTSQIQRYAKIADACNMAQIWGLEDDCLDKVSYLAAQKGDLKEMVQRQSRLQYVQNDLERDRASLLSTQCGHWRARNQKDHGQMLYWFSVFENQYPLGPFFTALESSVPSPDDWDIPAVRYRMELVKYHTHKRAKSYQAAAKALKSAQKILPFVPMGDIQQLGSGEGESWYFEWISPHSVDSINDFKVLAWRFCLSFGNITEEDVARNATLRKLFYPKRAGDSNTLWSWKPPFKIIDTTADDVEKLLFPSPMEERSFAARISALEEWFSQDKLYDPDASQLLIANLLHGRIWCTATTGDAFVNLKANTSRFVEYVGQIKNQSVRKYLQRTVLRAKQTPFDFELQLHPEPDLAKLKLGFLELLQCYEKTDLAGEYALIGNLYGQLAEIELRSAQHLEGLLGFRERIKQSEKYFDDLRGGLSLLPGSLGLRMKGTSPTAGLMGNRKPLDRPIELLLDRYFDIAESAVEVRQTLARDIWNYVQRIKERSLNDMLSLANQMPQRLMEEVSKDPDASRGWVEWQAELKQLEMKRQAGTKGKVSAPSVETARRLLRDCESRMMKNKVLARVLDLHRGSVASIEELAETLQGGPADEETVLVDWFTATKSKILSRLYIIVLIVGPESKKDPIHIFEVPAGTGPKSMNWVKNNLNVPEPNEVLAMPNAYSDLQSISGLVEPLAEVLRPRQRLVFCPCTTWSIHRVPLHALELPKSRIESGLTKVKLEEKTSAPSLPERQTTRPQNLLLFQRHKITYTHSCFLLRLSALSRRGRLPSISSEKTNVAIFNTLCASFGKPARKTSKLRADPASIQELSIATNTTVATLEEIARSTANISYMLGSRPHTNKDVTRTRILQSLRQSALTWFMGHVDGGSKDSPLDAHLVLSPESPHQSAPTGSLTGEAIISESTIPECAHLTLISCRGGVTEENARDEVLGLVPALFQAGARSVSTPLWEINKEDGATWASLLRDEWESAEYGVRGDGDRDGATMLDLASVCQEASQRLFEIRGRENVGAWAGFVFYGFWDFPRLPISFSE